MAQTYVVAVYLSDRAYGGPEEGGWYYDCGELVRTVRCFRSEEKAYEYSRRLNARLLFGKNADGELNPRWTRPSIGPNVGRRDISSVLSEGEYQACVYEGTAPKAYPETRPYYE